MRANKFELIEEPSSVPLTLDAYHTQNKILKEMRFLHTAFDGIKLAILDKYKPPIILKGSICPFCYSIFEAKEDIILEDNFRQSNQKYIILKLSSNGKELIPEITETLIANYNEELGGFYHITNNAAAKYIQCIINSEVHYILDVEFIEYKISYFDIYNNEVY